MSNVWKAINSDWQKFGTLTQIEKVLEKKGLKIEDVAWF